MTLFGRNEDEDFEDEDVFNEEEDRQDRRLTKKFRDLKPENKRKRKEPPKSWGKKERLVVLIILLVTVIVSAILAIDAKKGGLHPGFPKIDLKSLNVFKEETIIVGKK